MNALALLTAAAGAAALASVLPARGAAAARLRAIGAPRGGSADDSRALADDTSSRRVWMALAAATVGVALAGPTGLAGVAAVVVLLRLRRRGHADRVRRASVQLARRDGPLVADLLAGCTRAGVSLAASMRVVGAATTSVPISSALRTATAALERGQPVDAAAEPLRGCGLDELAVAIAAAESGGPGLASALAAVAADMRAAAHASAQATAKRAGVWSVGPLALCFLPAFVLLGVVPVVAGLLGTALP